MTDETSGAVPLMWAGGRRVRHPSGRHLRMSLRLSPTEDAALRRRAVTAGVSPQRYLLEATLSGGQVTVADRRRRVADLGFISRQLVGLATNVNQLAKVANSTGVIPAGTARAMATTEQVGRRLARVVEQISRICDS